MYLMPTHHVGLGTSIIQVFNVVLLIFQNRRNHTLAFYNMGKISN